MIPTNCGMNYFSRTPTLHQNVVVRRITCFNIENTTLTPHDRRDVWLNCGCGPLRLIDSIAHVFTFVQLLALALILLQLVQLRLLAKLRLRLYMLRLVHMRMLVQLWMRLLVHLVVHSASPVSSFASFSAACVSFVFSLSAFAFFVFGFPQHHPCVSGTLTPPVLVHALQHRLPVLRSRHCKLARRHCGIRAVVDDPSQPHVRSPHPTQPSAPSAVG